ncbi:hypothetical protein HDE_04834 [Halotydeus destructor]|nr:hypothetical protein HDE_04834 [Halotydeus destructor]
MEVLRTSSHFGRRQSSPDTLSMSRMIPEVKESNVIMSGILEVDGLTNMADSITTSSAGVHLRRAHRLANGCQKVIVCVYLTSREHFAVVYPLKMMISARRPIISINLRTSSVFKMADNEGFRVELQKEKRLCSSLSSGDRLCFRINAAHRLSPDSPVELDRWVEAFTRSSCGRRSPTESVTSRAAPATYVPVMATVAETEADE